MGRRLYLYIIHINGYHHISDTNVDTNGDAKEEINGDTSADASQMDEVENSHTESQLDAEISGFSSSPEDATSKTVNGDLTAESKIVENDPTSKQTLIQPNGCSMNEAKVGANVTRHRRTPSSILRGDVDVVFSKETASDGSSKQNVSLSPCSDGDSRSI